MNQEQDEIFTQLYHKYFNQIKLYIMSFISDPHLAEEIAQDTFHTAMTKIDDLISTDPPIAWLKKTAKYKVLNAQRKRMRHLKHFLSLDDPLTPQIITETSVEDLVIVADELRQQEPVEKRIYDALSPEERILFQRAILDQIPYSQLSEELNITLWTCQKRVQRLRTKLQKKLSQNGKDNFDN